MKQKYWLIEDFHAPISFLKTMKRKRTNTTEDRNKKIIDLLT